MNLNTLTCFRKGRYDSAKKARRYARKSLKREPGLRLWTYVCPICQAWHLTHRPDNPQLCEEVFLNGEEAV